MPLPSTLEFQLPFEVERSGGRACLAELVNEVTLLQLCSAPFPYKLQIKSWLLEET